MEYSVAIGNNLSVYVYSMEDGYAYHFKKSTSKVSDKDTIINLIFTTTM